MQIRRFRIGRVILAFGLLLAPAIAPAADPPLTTRQREALSPGRANQTVQKDLLSVLKPVKQIRSGMFRMLRGVGTETRPFGTEYKGVCRRDSVTLWYAPTDEAAKPEDVPVQPYSIEAAPLFHIVKLPVADSTARQGGELVWQTVCNGLDGDDTSWFGATDAFHAVQGALVLEQAVRGVRSGTLKPAPCPDIIQPDKASCSEAILSVGDVQKIGQIETCAAGSGTLCYVIDLDGDTKLTITAKGDPDSVVPQGALSISVEQYIVVT